jgi:hypothetical protein
MQEAILVTPPAQGERSLTLEIVCRDNAKAWLVFDQINGELLDHGSLTLEVTKPRRKHRLRPRDSD